MMDGLEEKIQLLEFDYNKLFSSTSIINNKFDDIWNKIVKKIDLNIIFNKEIEMKNLVIYDILDGNRSTLTSKSMFNNCIETTLYTLHLIHTLKALGARNCYFMIHTSYNKERGRKEFNYILKKISQGAPVIKDYSIKNSVHCSCIGMEKNYELKHLLDDVMESTKTGNFHSYFLFDYNEMRLLNNNMKDIFMKLPDIDVYIRHTKFQPSGGWIPSKMSHSTFLYSQNGTTYSNWESDEIIFLIALALLSKVLHRDEILNKTYATIEEINQRYNLRELQLFNKTIEFRESPKKLFMMGSPVGVYHFYY